MTAVIPAAALNHHIGILGKTGAGKSHAAQGLAERLIEAKQRICIIDPTDRYWGLRLLADGKNPSGYEIIIFGGAHADLPLAATHGATLAEIVGTTTTPAIISTRHMTVGERTRFFTDFAETLIRKNDGPLHLIIDESHLFAPQGGAKVGGMAPAMLHATNNLVSLGRGVGLRIMLLSQRPAKLHKDCITQVETLIAMRLIAPQDRNAIRDWIKEWADESTGAELMSSLPSLPTGTAWLWAPELDVLKKVAFPRNSTFDSGAPPAAGKRGPSLKPIDLAAVRGKLEIVAKEAIENDPKRLKARIAELERSLAAKPKAEMDQAQLDAIVERAKQRGRDEAAEEVAELEASLDRAVRTISDIEGTASGFMTGGAADRKRKPMKPPAARPVTAAPRQASSSSPAPVRKTNVAAGGPLSGGERKILTVLAQYPSGRTKRQIGILAGYAVNGGAFNNYLGSLRSKGAIEGANTGMIAITDLGRDLLGPYDPLPTGRALLDHWLSQLDKAPRLVLSHLAASYPDQVGKRELAEAIGYESSGGGFNNALSRLRTLELISGSNKLMAAEELFE
jgi:hypothetical protein